MLVRSHPRCLSNDRALSIDREEFDETRYTVNADVTPASGESVGACRFEVTQPAARDGPDVIEPRLIDEKRADDEISCLQGPFAVHPPRRAALLAQRLEQHAVDRTEHEARFERHEFTSVAATRNEALDPVSYTHLTLPTTPYV